MVNVIKPVGNELRKLGYKIKEISIGEQNYEQVTSPGGKTWITRNLRLMAPDDITITDMANNKKNAYQFVDYFGLNIPSTIYSDNASERDIEELLNSAKKIIVKPLDSRASKGLTVNIDDLNNALTAITEALKISDVAIIQEQIDAEEYRFVVIDGSVVSILKRERPRVIGDGVRTLAELIEEENAKRREFNLINKNEYISYPMLDDHIIDKETLTSKATLDNGSVKILSNATMISKGASVYEVLGQVDDSYIKKIEHVIKQMGIDTIAADLFIEDIFTPMKKRNYWFNEFNMAFSLTMYYAVRNSNNLFVVEAVIKKIIDHLESDKGTAQWTLSEKM